MRTLFVKKLFLWPRFRLEIAQNLEHVNQPDVLELTLPLTSHMKAIQNAILVCMNTCIQELKKSCPSLDTSFLTLENGLFQAFDTTIRNALDPEWYKISYRTKQIISDLTTLRRLLGEFFYMFTTQFFCISTELFSRLVWLLGCRLPHPLRLILVLLLASHASINFLRAISPIAMDDH